MTYCFLFKAICMEGEQKLETSQMEILLISTDLLQSITPQNTPLTVDTPEDASVQIAPIVS